MKGQLSVTLYENALDDYLFVGVEVDSAPGAIPLILTRIKELLEGNINKEDVLTCLLSEFPEWRRVLQPLFMILTSYEIKEISVIRGNRVSHFIQIILKTNIP